MIEVQGLHFTYPGAPAQTLNGLDFSVEAGEIFGFLGPSGSGKSTTQKILIGLLTGYSGQVRVRGREVRDQGADLYEHIGVSFEAPNHHLRLSALENLQHFGSLYQGPLLDPMAVLESVGLADDANKPVSDFSKGMKIRLNVARSLLHQPELLFLDEPTSGLDPVSARHMRELIERTRQAGTTVFLTTHDMHVADTLCDRVAFLCGGSIAALDAPEKLRREHGRRSVRVEADDGRAEEFALDGLADNADFLSFLRSGPIATVHSQETTLENVFIDVTGESLR